MAASPPPADLSAYSPPASLWKLIENNVPEHEQQEMKNMLGEFLVEQSLELHEEIEALLEIWRDYREETNEVNITPKRLPEPPALRHRLRQEICFFVNRIREKSNETGSNAEHVLAKHNSDVLAYVMEQKRPESSGYFSRPSTARSSTDGRETPMCRLGTPTSDRFSQTSLLSEEVESMSDKLNILKLDEVTTHLRETLKEEIEYLLTDISFLQGCLEDEAEFRSQSTIAMVDQDPTISELRVERNKLEKDLLTSESPLPLMLQEKMSNSPRCAAGFSPSPYSQPQSSNRPRPTVSGPGSAGRSRPGPIKASHHISATQVLTVHQNDTPEAQKVSRVRRARSIGRENQAVADANNASATHVTIRTGSPGSLPRSARLVKVGSVSAPRRTLPADNAGSDLVRHIPSPPSDARVGPRPSSANRFRKMVHGCRDHDESPPVGGAS